jgi:plasmid stabilization system protein ParE
VAQDSPQNARRLLSDLLDGAASLAEFSERGRQIPELLGTGVRELLIYPYRLMYEVPGSRVVVVALLHQRRDFERWQRSVSGEPSTAA